jgi:hypothetical protein
VSFDPPIIVNRQDFNAWILRCFDASILAVYPLDFGLSASYGLPILQQGSLQSHPIAVERTSTQASTNAVCCVRGAIEIFRCESFRSFCDFPLRDVSFLPTTMGWPRAVSPPYPDDGLPREQEEEDHDEEEIARPTPTRARALLADHLDSQHTPPGTTTRTDRRRTTTKCRCKCSLS